MENLDTAQPRGRFQKSAPPPSSCFACTCFCFGGGSISTRPGASKKSSWFRQKLPPGWLVSLHVLVFETESYAYVRKAASQSLDLSFSRSISICFIRVSVCVADPARQKQEAVDGSPPRTRTYIGGTRAYIRMRKRVSLQVDPGTIFRFAVGSLACSTNTTGKASRPVEKRSCHVTFIPLIPRGRNATDRVKTSTKETYTSFLNENRHPG